MFGVWQLQLAVLFDILSAATFLVELYCMNSPISNPLPAKKRSKRGVAFSTQTSARKLCYADGTIRDELVVVSAQGRGQSVANQRRP